MSTESKVSKDSIVVGQMPQGGLQVPPRSEVQLMVAKPDRLPTVFSKQLSAEDRASRWNRWSYVSLCPNIRKLEDAKSWHFPTTIQQLGRLDLKIIEEEIAFSGLSKNERRSGDNTRLAFERGGLASLWVMGSFQLIYTLEQRMRDRRVVFEGMNSKISEAKAAFTRLRSPLAKGKSLKLQKGQGKGAPSSSADFPFPWQAVTVDGSVGWYLNPETIISRLDLSNKLLLLLESIAKAKSL